MFLIHNLGVFLVDPVSVFGTVFSRRVKQNVMPRSSPFLKLFVWAEMQNVSGFQQLENVLLLAPTLLLIKRSVINKNIVNGFLPLLQIVSRNVIFFTILRFQHFLISTLANQNLIARCEINLLPLLLLPLLFLVILLAVHSKTLRLVSVMLNHIASGLEQASNVLQNALEEFRRLLPHLRQLQHFVIKILIATLLFSHRPVRWTALFMISSNVLRPQTPTTSSISACGMKQTNCVVRLANISIVTIKTLANNKVGLCAVGTTSRSVVSSSAKPLQPPSWKMSTIGTEILLKVNPHRKHFNLERVSVLVSPQQAVADGSCNEHSREMMRKELTRLKSSLWRMDGKKEMSSQHWEIAPFLVES
jgi:hypothetical protein